MKKKIVSLMPLKAEIVQKVLEANHGFTDVEVVGANGLPEDEVIKLVGDATVIIGDWSWPTKNPITRNIVMAAKETKLIQQPSLGIDNIDEKACAEAGITIANAAGANEISVAEHTIMLALSLARKITFLNSAVQTGKWPPIGEYLATGPFELAGKKWGIVGMGNIGKVLAKRLVSFGVSITYFKRNKLSAEEERKYDVTYESLDEIFKTADIISLLLPLTDHTRGMIGSREIGLMKNNAVIINVGRGGTLDENALAEAIKEKKIAGAALDVFETEPISKDNPLLGLDNVILTPHSAGATVESAPRFLIISLENIARVLKGEEPFNVVG